MGGGNKLPTSSIKLLLIILYSISISINASYAPPDNYLIDCGSPQNTILDDGRTFKSDSQSVSFLSTGENIFATSNSLPGNTSLPLYKTSRIFDSESVYKFLVFQPGRHFIRLYFHPIPHQEYNLTSAVFTVKTADGLVLLHDFSCIENTHNSHFKEYLINVTSEDFSLIFSPLKKSFAFVNAIEFVSAPNELVPDTATAMSPPGVFIGVTAYNLQVVHRVNVGGPTVTPKNDTLSRTWVSDNNGCMVFPQGDKVVSVDPSVVNYPAGGATPLIAPNQVYSTAASMADSGVSVPNFNLTWEMNIDPGFNYLVRLHFCDIVSASLNSLYFNVYVNGLIGVSGLDLSALTSELAVAYYKDFVVNASSVRNGVIRVQVGPSDLETTIPNAILNGLEVMKMSNSVGSLDGVFSSGSNSPGGSKRVTRTVAEAASVAIGGIMILVLIVSLVRRKNKARGFEEGGNSFTSWFLPINASCSNLLSSKSKSKNGYSSVMFSKVGLGRSFGFNELRDATKNFDESVVIGVGGFGKVYIGEVEPGKKLAIKRGNPKSSQGINEFQTEIELLSKLRHRHLVSLIGYCDENNEMILVYEYMANGPLRDHLYGSKPALPLLSWRQRLEISIGAARGLHYLHTGGSSQGIIHRDVKTTNILLDENFVAKVSDFGLSKTGPTLDQTHVSTAVKGSFGYLDPEYFRRQQLTEKSDVYSFGVVLFEILCARPALDPTLPREQVNLAEWAMQKQRKGVIDTIVDPKIAKTISSESLAKYVEAAEKCLAEYGVDRPSMGDVLWNLEFALQLQDASLQLDPPEEDDACKAKKAKMVDYENVKKDDEKKKMNNESDVSILINDDSGVVMGSPLFSKMEDIEGR